MKKRPINKSLSNSDQISHRGCGLRGAVRACNTSQLVGDPCESRCRDWVGQSESCNIQGKVDVMPTRVKNRRIKGEGGKARQADMSDLRFWNMCRSSKNDGKERERIESGTETQEDG